jgi:hypothetical protein
VFTVQPYLQDPAAWEDNQVQQAAMTVMWETDQAPTDYALNYRQGEQGTFTSVTAGNLSSDGQITELRLADLSPDKVYQYWVQATVGGQTIRSPAQTDTYYTFRTPPATPPDQMRFLVYGDSRKMDNGTVRHGTVVNDILNQQFAGAGADPSFVLHAGDMVRQGQGQRADWTTEFFDPVTAANGHPMPTLLSGVPTSQSGARPGTPIIPVEGDKEYAGTGTHLYDGYFAPPANGVTGYDEKFFAFSYGNVRVICLDTASASAVPYGVGDWYQSPQVPPSAQYTWLDNEFDSAAYVSAAWHIVVLHDPIYTCCNGYPERQYPVISDSLAAMFETHGVDVVFSAHNQIYERYSHNGVTYIVTGGGGADSNSLVTDTTAPVRQVGAQGLSYCAVDVTKQVAGGQTLWDLTVRTYVDPEADGDAQLFDSVTLQHNPRSTVVVLPDTQFYSSSHPSSLNCQTQWVADHRDADRVAFLTHVGDVVDRNVAAQWVNANTAMGILDAQVPDLVYGVCAGNHDYDTYPNGRAATVFSSPLPPATTPMRFGPGRYLNRWGSDTYGYSTATGIEGLNHYQVFTAAGRQFLNISLEWYPRQASVEWAKGVILDHPYLPVIITTHRYLTLSPTLRVDPSYPAVDKTHPDYHSGADIFSELVRPNPQVFMVLCGHATRRAYLVSADDPSVGSRNVYQMMSDYQDMGSDGGQGYLRLLNFMPDQGVIHVSTYSPTLRAYSSESGDDFDVPIGNFAARFNISQSYIDHVLHIYGTTGDDTIALTVDGSGYVKLNGTVILPHVSASDVQAIRVDGNGGSDTIDLSAVTTTAFPSVGSSGVTVQGRDGSDTFTLSVPAANAPPITVNGVADTAGDAIDTLWVKSDSGADVSVAPGQVTVGSAPNQTVISYSNIQAFGYNQTGGAAEPAFTFQGGVHAFLAGISGTTSANLVVADNSVLDLHNGTATVKFLTLYSGSVVNGTVNASTMFEVWEGWINADLEGTAGLWKRGPGTVTLYSWGQTGDEVNAMNYGGLAVSTAVTSSTVDGTYKAGDVIEIEVPLCAEVTVTGSPQLELNTGATHRMAEYAGDINTPTDTLEFSYTVQPGDTSADLDYASRGALDLNGGAILGPLGNALLVTLLAPGDDGSLSAAKDLVIDGAVPVVTSIARTGPAVLYPQDVQFAVTFSRSVTGVDVTDFALAITGTATGAITSVSGSGTTYTVTVTGVSGNGGMRLDVVDDDTIVDAVGNTPGGPGAGNGNFTGEAYTIDTHLYYDADGDTTSATGGDGPWDNVARWRLGGPTGALQCWLEGADAVFAGTAGLITVAATVHPHSITFLTPGYHLAADTGASLDVGDGATIDLPGAWASIDADVTGDGGLTVPHGLLVLAGPKSYLGDTVVAAGAVLIVRGTMAGNIVNYGALWLPNYSALAYEGTVTGTGTVEMYGIADSAPTTDAPLPAADAYDAAKNRPLAISPKQSVLANDRWSMGESWQFNLNDGFMILAKAENDTGELEALVRSLLIQGLGDDPLNAPWSGTTGLFSTIAAANAGTCAGAIGFADAAALGLQPGDTYQGMTIPAYGAVIVRYCYYGDADLNGLVDESADLQNYMDGLNASVTNQWVFGDFDYSGVVDDAYDLPVYTYGYLFQDGALTSPSPQYPLAAFKLTDPSHGTLEMASDGSGSFTYTPDTDFVGTDSFTYVVVDKFSGLPSVATASIVVHDSLPPEAVDDSYEAVAATPLVVSAQQGVLANDTVDLTAPGWSFDLKDGFMIFAKAEGDGGELEALLRSLLVQGVGDGSFNGTTGLFSTVAAANWGDFAGAIGFADAADLGLLPGDDYQGATIPAYGAVIVRYCYLGDADLNGLVDDSDDLDQYLAGLNGSVTNQWVFGDFDYSGVVDDSNDLQAYTYGYLFQADPLTSPLPQYPLTAYALTNPAHGTLRMAKDGSFTYTAMSGFTGTDTFTYMVVDKFSGLWSTATVVITVE